MSLRYIKKALMKAKGIKTQRVEFLTHNGKVFGTRNVSTVGEHRLIVRHTGPGLRTKKAEARSSRIWPGCWPWIIRIYVRRICGAAPLRIGAGLW